VADEYVTATGEKVDFDSFKNSADKLKLKERDELETLAETIGLRLKQEHKPSQLRLCKHILVRQRVVQ